MFSFEQLRVAKPKLRSPSELARNFLLAWVICLFAGLSGDHVAAQSAMDTASSTVTDSVSDEDYGFRAGSFVVAPIPFKNPTLGAGLALGAGYLFQMDERSDTSVFGLGAMRSNNGSFAYGASANIAWNNNKWILGATFGEADLNYNLYVAGIPVPINQTGVLFKGSLLYGLTPELAAGGKIRYLDTTVSVNGPGGLPPVVGLDSSAEVVALSFVTKWDTRDSSLYPLQGHLMNFEAMVGNTLSSIFERTYSKAFVNFGLYRSLTESTVLASQLSTCSASSDTPFFDKCSLGGTDSFRGFSATQFLDLNSLSVQVELRQTLSKRFRAIVFAGAGMTGSDYSTLDAGGIHAAGGVGVRFKLSQKFDADLSFDASYNDQGDDLYYIYVGQRF